MKKSMMKVMSMALVIASVMSISAMSVSAREYSDETYKNRTKSTYTVPIVAPEANYERPEIPKNISDIRYNYLDDGRIVITYDKYQDYVIDRNLDVAYGLYYFDDGDVVKKMDVNFPGCNNMKGYVFSIDYVLSNLMEADYTEKPDDRRVGDFIIGKGYYQEVVWVISPNTTREKVFHADGTIEIPSNPIMERAFKSEWIVKKYLGKGGLVTLPEGAEAIAPGVFQNNKTISKIVFPKSFKNVPENAFLGCSANHLVFKSSESIFLKRPNINFSSKTVLEFYTPAERLCLFLMNEGNGDIDKLVNLKERTSKSSLVIYCYGDPKNSLLKNIGMKAIYTKKIAYP